MCWIDLAHMPSWKNCRLFTNCENSTWPPTVVLGRWYVFLLQKLGSNKPQHCKIASFGWKQCFIFSFKQIKNLSYEPLQLLLLKTTNRNRSHTSSKNTKRIIWLPVSKNSGHCKFCIQIFLEARDRENPCIWKRNRVTEIKSVWAIWNHKKFVILLQVQRTVGVNKCTGLCRK